MDLFIFIIENMLIMFGTIIIVTVIHEIGHAMILKAAGGKPIIKINLFKGSKTIAEIPRTRKTEIQAVSAANAILYGAFCIFVFMFNVVIYNKQVEFFPAMFGIITFYIVGIRKDIQNIKQWYKTK